MIIVVKMLFVLAISARKREILHSEIDFSVPMPASIISLNDIHTLTAQHTRHLKAYRLSIRTKAKESISDQVTLTGSVIRTRFITHLLLIPSFRRAKKGKKRQL